MTFDKSKQLKAAHKEALGTWVSPMSLSLIFTVAISATVLFNGI